MVCSSQASWTLVLLNTTSGWLQEYLHVTSTTYSTNTQVFKQPAVIIWAALRYTLNSTLTLRGSRYVNSSKHRNIYTSTQSGKVQITAFVLNNNTIVGQVTTVRACVHFLYLVLGETQNIGQFLPPTDLIQKRLITDILTWIAVKPSALSDGVNLCPHVVWNSTGNTTHLHQQITQDS